MVELRSLLAESTKELRTHGIIRDEVFFKIIFGEQDRWFSVAMIESNVLEDRTVGPWGILGSENLVSDFGVDRNIARYVFKLQS
jgi:hypothetical protein